MQQAVSQLQQFVELEESPIPPRIKEISDRVKVIHFGVTQETRGSSWDRLAGMFTMGKPVDIEEMLDARGFEETADDF